MIRLIISYLNRSPLNIITGDFNTSDEFKQRWLSEPSNNFMVSAPQGGALITKTDVSSFIIDELDENSNVIKRDEFTIDALNNWKPIRFDEIKIEYPDGTIQDVEIHQVTTEEETKNILIPEKEGDIPMAEEAMVLEVVDDPIEEEVVPVVEENDTFVVDAEPVIDNKINEKFMSFREKFLDRETRCDSFENSIIEKMDRRLQKLEEFAAVLDGENDYLEEFKQEKLGK